MQSRFAQLKLFQSVDKKTVEQLWELGKVIQYKKGEHCFRAKDQTVNVYVLLSGKVAIYNLTHTGKRKTIFYYGAGALLGDHILRESVPAVSCEVMDESEVFVIRKEHLLRCMAQDFSLVEAIISEYERKMFRLGHQLKNTMGCVPLERKLGSKLWKLSRDFGIVQGEEIAIDLPLSITELADFLGAPRESTSRAMKKLVEKQLIRMEQKQIYVVSPARLAQYYKTGEV